MRRREFIAGLGSTAAWPVLGWAQKPALPVIGFLHPQSADDPTNFTVAFLQGLKEAGYVDGQNAAVEYRYAENQVDRVTSGVNLTENHRFEFPHFAANVDLRRMAEGCGHFPAPLHLSPHAHSIVALGDRAWPRDSPL